MIFAGLVAFLSHRFASVANMTGHDIFNSVSMECLMIEAVIKYDRNHDMSFDAGLAVAKYTRYQTFITYV